MADHKKKRHHYEAQKANSTHVLLLGLVGAYLMYMAYQMLKNTRSGNSSMSMGVTVTLMVVMVLVGLAIWSYAGYVYYQMVKHNSQSQDETAQSVQADEGVVNLPEEESALEEDEDDTDEPEET